MHPMQLSGFDANLFVTLHALLEEENVGRAAKRVGLSPSAMSHALARLRETFADALLVRAGRRLVATPRAATLREVVRRSRRGPRRCARLPAAPCARWRPCSSHIPTSCRRASGARSVSRPPIT